MTGFKQCNPGNAELFFRLRPAADRDEAIERCLNCPLMIACRDLGRAEGHMHGTWGAEIPEERMEWMVGHHPDPEVREEAEAELDRLQHSRESRRDPNPQAPQNDASVAGDGPAMPVTPTHSGNARQAIAAHERAVNAWTLYRNGTHPNDIAEELGCSRRTVERYLARAAA